MKINRHGRSKKFFSRLAYEQVSSVVATRRGERPRKRGWHRLKAKILSIQMTPAHDRRIPGIQTNVD